MMPFAFDLISTLVMGSIFPVATTERVMVARSTVASRVGSVVEEAPFSVERPQAAATASTTMTAPTRLHFLDFFMTDVLTTRVNGKLLGDGVPEHIRTVKPCGC